MRRHWKVLGGAGLLGAGLGLFIVVGHSRVSRGDTTDTPSGPAPAAADANAFDPERPYGLGAHPISYDQLSPVEKADVDQILETEAVSQPDTSFALWADAAATAAADAQAQIAARSVGLVGTDQDGVTP